jgi:hypothetical protein
MGPTFSQGQAFLVRPLDSPQGRARAGAHRTSADNSLRRSGFDLGERRGKQTRSVAENSMAVDTGPPRSCHSPVGRIKAIARVATGLTRPIFSTPHIQPVPRDGGQVKHGPAAGGAKNVAIPVAAWVDRQAIGPNAGPAIDPFKVSLLSRSSRGKSGGWFTYLSQLPFSFGLLPP